MKLLKLLTIVLIIVVAGCTDDLLETETLTDDALKSGHKKPITFESEFQLVLESRTDIYVIPPDDLRPRFDQVVLGTGKARHLGKTKLNVEETIYVDTYPFEGNAIVTFTAANGDQLIFTTISDISFKGNRDDKIMIIESVKSLFVEGTGRFKNAIGGTLHKDGIFDDNNGTGTATYKVIVEFEKK